MRRMALFTSKSSVSTAVREAPPAPDVHENGQHLGGDRWSAACRPVGHQGKSAGYGRRCRPPRRRCRVLAGASRSREHRLHRSAGASRSHRHLPSELVNKATPDEPSVLRGTNAPGHHTTSAVPSTADAAASERSPAGSGTVGRVRGPGRGRPGWWSTPRRAAGREEPDSPSPAHQVRPFSDPEAEPVPALRGCCRLRRRGSTRCGHR